VPRRARSPRGIGIREALRTAWTFIRNRGRAIPDEETASVKRRIIQFDPYSPAAEQFRGIRTRVELLNEGGACRVLAVTSALPGEGKTLTSINLALVMAMSLERRVVLVDCDLEPKIHSTLAAVEFGLTEVLRGEVPLERALIEMPKEGLTVLPAGALPSNPAELLGTQRLRETVALLRERFDYVILDTPAALPVSDPEIICNLADGIIFVVRAGSTPREQVLRAMDNFSRADRRHRAEFSDADRTPSRRGEHGGALGRRRAAGGPAASRGRTAPVWFVDACLVVLLAAIP
jgi:receptor protein-tyrosine kinase